MHTNGRSFVTCRVNISSRHFISKCCAAVELQTLRAPNNHSDIASFALSRTCELPRSCT